MSHAEPVAPPSLMQASVFNETGGLTVQQFEMPMPGPGQLLVQMVWGSVCGSDVHMVFEGMHAPAMVGQPGFPGHEGVGIVIEGDIASAPDGIQIGDAVLTAPIGSEGRCFAQYQAVDAKQVVAVPDGLDLQQALMAQQLGTTVFGMRKFWSDPKPPRVAVVQGAGSAGTFFQQLLALRGTEIVIVSEPLEHRRAVAEKLGAWKVVAPDELSDVVAEATDGLGADLIIEAAGFDASRTQAVELVRKDGTVGLFGFPERMGPSPFPVHLCFRKAVDVQFTVGAQTEPGIPAFREAMRLIARGLVKVDYCIGEVFPLERVQDAMDAARTYRGVKSVVDLR